MTFGPRFNRREFLIGAGSAAGIALLAFPPIAQASIRRFDLRSKVPEGIAFSRKSPGSWVDNDGVVQVADSDVPRFCGTGATAGLLIEGALVNGISNSKDLKAAGWNAGGTAHLEWVATETAPDGSRGVFRLDRGEPQPSSEFFGSTRENPGDRMVCASVWMRAVTGTGKWRLRLRDFKTYDGIGTVIDVGPRWQRYALPLALQPKDNGSKHFSLIENAPHLDDHPDSINFGNPYSLSRTPIDLRSVYVWGPQFEPGATASSYVPSGTPETLRAADEVSFASNLLTSDSGRITLLVPQGGARGTVLLDAGNAERGLRLGYTESGWLEARVNGVRMTGTGDATELRCVRLEWRRGAAQLSGGVSEAQLDVQAVVEGDAIDTPDLGATVRLGMAQDGSQPFNRTLAAIEIGRFESVTSRAIAAPTVIPARYRMTFGDDFDDADVSRINENATGGRPGAPAWRSRYRQGRETVINSEKQIYMDPQFAGTGSAPLGVQPFQIASGVLSLIADRADATVAPLIWNHRYTSGCITSELTHWQTYGYFEMRARMPRGKGFWPAFWLLPKRDAWPPEIDVFEVSGWRRFGFHCGVIQKMPGQPGAKGTWIDQFIDVTDGFHTYAVEWTADDIVVIVDGRRCWSYGAHAIHEDMYLLANLALGSKDQNWIPNPDDGTPFPARFEIDYVHAYQRT